MFSVSVIYIYIYINLRIIRIVLYGKIFFYCYVLVIVNYMLIYESY